MVPCPASRPYLRLGSTRSGKNPGKARLSDPPDLAEIPRGTLTPEPPLEEPSCNGRSRGAEASEGSAKLGK